MRKAILACILLTFGLVVFGQHKNPEPSGKTVSKPKVKAKPKRDNFTQPWVSPCGVYYASGISQIVKDIEIEWRLVAHNDDTEFYWNTKKTVCNRSTGILETWIKTIFKSPDNEVATRMMKYELNCPSSRTRMIYLANYDSKGKALVSGDLVRNWQEVVPDSMMEGALNAVCHKRF